MSDKEPQRGTDEILSWIDRYAASRLVFKRETTKSTYSLILRQFLIWLSCRPGYESSFDAPPNLTQTAVQLYLFDELANTSVSHRERVKSILSGFAEWLIDEELLTRNPTKGIEFPAQQLLAPRELSTDQRYILKELIEAEDLRGKAMFSLGYYAGCRASDVCWFRLDQVHHLTKKSGQITVGYKRGQLRTIDLTNEARKALSTKPGQMMLVSGGEEVPEQKPPSPSLSELEAGQKQAVLFRHIQPMRVNNHVTRFLEYLSARGAQPEPSGLPFCLPLTTNPRNNQTCWRSSQTAD
jgi:integrase